MWIVAALIVLPLAVRLLLGLATRPIATLVGIARVLLFLGSEPQRSRIRR